MEQTLAVAPNLPMVSERQTIMRPQLQPVITANREEQHERSFITANSQPITLESLGSDYITPVFARDNEVCISHNLFIGSVYDAVREFFSGETVDEPLIRVSHIVKGRIPEAIHKKASELLPSDITEYYERSAFCINVPSIVQDVCGNPLNLSVVGVKSYGRDNLGGRLTPQRFSVAVGFQNTVCCNMCIFTDGYKEEIRALRDREIYFATLTLLNMFDMAKQITLLRSLGDLMLDERQFCQIIGRMRLYSYLPANMQRTIPQMLITDSQINNVAKQYFRDDNFRAEDNGEISLWKFYNLITGSTKNSYIDTFLSRSASATETVMGIASGLRDEDSGYKWFLG